MKADALLDAGADIEAAGAVIAGGTPLDDAVAFGQWQAAGRLVERGAHASLLNAAALGLLDRLRELLAPGADRAEISSGFWAAGRGQQPPPTTCCAKAPKSTGSLPGTGTAHWTPSAAATRPTLQPGSPNEAPTPPPTRTRADRPSSVVSMVR